MEPTCVIYGRIASKEVPNSGMSCQGQVASCKAYAFQKGLRVLDEFIDAGVSGKSLIGRDALMSALNFIQNNKVNYFLVTELDRLTRTHADHVSVKELMEKNECKLIVVNQPFSETDPPENQVINGMVSAVNEYYARLYSPKNQRRERCKSCGRY